MTDADAAPNVVVVTGASRGIGREIAAAFGRAGDYVVATARSRGGLEETRDLIQAAGGRAVAVECDLRDAAAVSALGERVREDFGRVDTLVCNSGIAGPTAELWTVSLDDWNETLQVNVTGVFLACRAMLPVMIEQRSGSVVVIGSMTGKRPLYGRTPYTTSKLALVGLVRTLAVETGQFGIRVNLISPGGTEGTRIDAVIEAQARAQGVSVEEARAQFSSDSPMRRLVRPHEVAAAAVFLASDAASGITGADLNVTTGQWMC